jgi:hypothetical protein
VVGSADKLKLSLAYFNYSSPLSSLSSGALSATSSATGGVSITATSGSTSTGTSTAKSSAGREVSSGGLVAVGVSVFATLVALVVSLL